MDQIGPLDQQIIDLIWKIQIRLILTMMVKFWLYKAKLKIEVALEGDRKDGRSTEDDFHSTCGDNNDKRR